MTKRKRAFRRGGASCGSPGIGRLRKELAEVTQELSDMKVAWDERDKRDEEERLARKRRRRRQRRAGHTKKK